MMKASSKELGKQAENEAANYLTAKGYKIIERNVRNRLGEIDLVVESKDTLVFVEVKAGRSDPDFAPHLHFNFKKRRKLIQLAQAYLSRSRGRSARIDLIEVRKSPVAFEIEHFENVVDQIV